MIGLRHGLALCGASLCVFGFASNQLRSLDSTRNGDGMLSYSRSTRRHRNLVSDYKIHRVRVNLQSNGRAQISILSGASETFTGSWKAGGLTKAYLTIDRISGGSANGTGQVVHDAKGEFSSVFCNGTVGDRHFDFRFESYGPTYWNEGPPNSRFEKAAKDALKDKFSGYTLSFSHVKVGREIFGNRNVTGDFEARGHGRKGGSYNFTIVCGAGTAKVKSVDYRRR